MVFHWGLSDTKSAQVSRTFLIMLTNLKNSVVWMVSAHPSISNSSNSLINSLGINLSAQITIGITVTFMFHSFFSSLAKFKYFFFFLFSLIFTLWPAGMVESTIWHVLFFLCIIIIIIIIIIYFKPYHTKRLTLALYNSRRVDMPYQELCFSICIYEEH